MIENATAIIDSYEQTSEEEVSYEQKLEDREGRNRCSSGSQESPGKCGGSALERGVKSLLKQDDSGSTAEAHLYAYRVRATAEYTLTNLRDIVDYSSRHTCVSGTPKWLVVEFHDAMGNVSYHRKIIRYKLYERRSRYVDTVATEFGFPEPEQYFIMITR